MIYFTSDLHLGHANIIRMCNRPFESVEEMDRTLIDNWNSRVTDRDDIYILGDLFYRSAIPPEERLKELKGRKHLLLGNHDYTWIRNAKLEKYFIDVRDLLVIKANGITATLCHYPMLSWPHSSYGGYMIFGHIHNSTQNADGWEYIKGHDHLLNAGVDINNFHPVSFEELVANNEAFKQCYS